MTERRQLIAGLGLILVGTVVAIVAAVMVHMAEAPEVDQFGQEMYSWFPRGWVVATIAQSISLGGTMIAMAGMAFAFIWKKPLTWARAMLGALLFTGLMFIIFAIIPNQMLTLFQATLEWTPQKIFVTIPPWLVLGQDISISYAALKDMLVAGFATTMLFVVPIVMYQIQERAKRADTPKPQPISDYGRPLRVPD